MSTNPHSVKGVTLKERKKREILQAASSRLENILRAKERKQPTEYHFKILRDAISEMVEGANVVYIAPARTDGKISGYHCKIIDAECNETIVFDVNESTYKRAKLIVDAEYKKESKPKTQGDKERDAKRSLESILKIKENYQATNYSFRELKDAKSVEQTKKGHHIVYIGAIMENGEYLCKIFDEKGYSKAQIRIKKSDYDRIVAVEPAISERQALIAEFTKKLTTIQETAYKTKESKEESGLSDSFLASINQWWPGSNSTLVEAPVDENKIFEEFIEAISEKIKTVDDLAKSKLTKIKIDAKVWVNLLPFKKKSESIRNTIEPLLKSSQYIENSVVDYMAAYVESVGIEIAENQAKLESLESLTQEEKDEIQQTIEQLREIQSTTARLSKRVAAIRSNKASLAEYRFERMQPERAQLSEKVIYISPTGQCKVLGEDGSSVYEMNLSSGLIQSKQFSAQLNDLNFQRKVLSELAQLNYVGFDVLASWRLALINLCDALNKDKIFFNENAFGMELFHQELEKIGIFCAEGEYELRLNKARGLLDYNKYVCDELFHIDVALNPEKALERQEKLAALHAEQFELDELSYSELLPNLPEGVKKAIFDINEFGREDKRTMFAGLMGEAQKKAEAMLDRQEQSSLKQTKDLLKKYEEERTELQSLEAVSMTEIKILEDNTAQLQVVNKTIEKIDEEKSLLSETLGQKEESLRQKKATRDSIKNNIQRNKTQIADITYESKLFSGRSERLKQVKEGIKNSISEFVGSNQSFKLLPSSMLTSIFGRSANQSLANRLYKIVKVIDEDPNVTLLDIETRFKFAISRFNKDKTGFFSSVTEEESKAVEDFCNRFTEDYRDFFRLEMELPWFNEDLLNRKLELGEEQKKLDAQSTSQQREILKISKEIKHQKGQIEALTTPRKEALEKQSNLDREIKDIQLRCANVEAKRKAVETTRETLTKRKIQIGVNIVMLSEGLAVSYDRNSFKDVLKNVDIDYHGQPVGDDKSSLPISMATSHLQRRSLSARKSISAANVDEESMSNAKVHQRRAVSMMLTPSDNPVAKKTRSSSLDSEESLAMAGITSFASQPSTPRFDQLTADSDDTVDAVSDSESDIASDIEDVLSVDADSDSDIEDILSSLDELCGSSAENTPKADISDIQRSSEVKERRDAGLNSSVSFNYSPDVSKVCQTEKPQRRKQSETSVWERSSASPTLLARKDQQVAAETTESLQHAEERDLISKHSSWLAKGFSIS